MKSIVLFSLLLFVSSALAERAKIHALYIPLADHYAALVAYERYRDQMVNADFELEQMGNWDLLRAKFQEGGADMAFVMSPLALDMYRIKPTFRWVGLMHRDGNGIAVNHLLADGMVVPQSKLERLPDAGLAKRIADLAAERKKPVVIGVPHRFSTHALVLYSYLKQHGLRLALMPNMPGEALVIGVAPPRAPAFIRGNGSRQIPAAIEQSLPWVEIVESAGFGKIVWFSKDVLNYPGGHVECIALASDDALSGRKAAVREVMAAIRQGGLDIEQARIEGGMALEEIVAIVQKHIPAHTRESILASLDNKHQVINYRNLDVDIPGMELIMKLGVESGLLRRPVNLQAFAEDLGND